MDNFNPRFITTHFAKGAVIALCALQMSAFAQRKYGMAGCGLGSVLFEDRASISAATFNSTSYNQGFAISSGTSNCKMDGRSVAEKNQEAFFVANYARISRESARGQGQSLDAFAETLGCSKEIYPEVAKQLQAQHELYFSRPGALATLESIREKMSHTQTIQNQCTKLATNVKGVAHENIR